MTTKTRAAGTNRAFEHTVTTEAGSAAVWRLWTDTDSWKHWDQGLKDAEMVGPMALGATGRIIPRAGPASRFRVTAFDAGKGYAFATSLSGARLVVHRAFTGEAPTRFTHKVWFEGGLAGVWSSLLGPGFRAALPPTMAALVTLAESDDAN